MSECCEKSPGAIIGVSIGAFFGLCLCVIATCYCPCCATPRRRSGLPRLPAIATGRPVPTATPMATSAVAGTRAESAPGEVELAEGRSARAAAQAPQAESALPLSASAVPPQAPVVGVPVSLPASRV